MSYRERCMSGVFRKILNQFGLFKDGEEEDMEGKARWRQQQQQQKHQTQLQQHHHHQQQQHQSHLHHHQQQQQHQMHQYQKYLQPYQKRQEQYYAYSSNNNNNNNNRCWPGTRPALPPVSHLVLQDAAAVEMVASMPSSKLATGFRIRVSVPHQKEPAPVVIECSPGLGGVQGLRWYSEKLMVDEDGDVAQEFLDEVVPSGGNRCHGTRVFPCFEVKMQTKPARLQGPVHTLNGNVHQSTEVQHNYNPV